MSPGMGQASLSASGSRITSNGRTERAGGGAWPRPQVLSGEKGNPDVSPKLWLLEWEASSTEASLVLAQGYLYAE